MVFSFKEFLERKHHSSHKDEPEDLVGSYWQQLGIEPNALPDDIPSGTTILPDQGLWFNQCIWRLVKPINKDDMFVKVRYFDADKTNPNFVRVYMKKQDGSYEPYPGKIEDGTPFLITLHKLAEILGQAFKTVTSSNPGGGLV